MTSEAFFMDRKQQVQEILKCGKNPVHFIKTYAKIQHPVKGLIKFDTYNFQDDCVKSFEKYRFNIVLKSRQLGLSTITAAYAVWNAIFRKDKNILVIATKLSTAVNFIRKVKVILDNIPKWLLLTAYEPTKQSISFTNGSKITAVPTSPDAGRSEALSLLIVDEAAFIRDFDTIWTGLYPTLSEGGSAIIISTPNGVGGQYYKLWTQAEAASADGSETKFNAIRLPWFVHPEHDQEWFDNETLNISKKTIAQEFMCDFISSGDTFLQPNDLEYVRNNIKNPIRKEGHGNGVWIWEEPTHTNKYVISADVARGDGADYSAFTVINVETIAVVAEFVGKIPPDKLADMLITYGKMYNNAVLCPERNTFGYFTCTKLRDSGYKYLYYIGKNGDLFAATESDGTAVPGFETNLKTRQQILTKMEELIRNRQLVSYSQRLYDQLQGFVWLGSKAQAARDCNDDIIMALAIGLWISSDDGGIAKSSEELAMAMLKATSVMKRDVTTIPSMNQVRPVVAPNVAMAHDSRSVYKTVDADTYIKKYDPRFDYSWLLR